jgi:hypothetical protein
MLRPYKTKPPSLPAGVFVTIIRAIDRCQNYETKSNLADQRI